MMTLKISPIYYLTVIALGTLLLTLTACTRIPLHDIRFPKEIEKTDASLAVGSVYIQEEEIDLEYGKAWQSHPDGNIAWLSKKIQENYVWLVEKVYFGYAHVSYNEQWKSATEELEQVRKNAHYLCGTFDKAATQLWDEFDQACTTLGVNSHIKNINDLKKMWSEVWAGQWRLVDEVLLEVAKKQSNPQKKKELEQAFEKIKSQLERVIEKNKERLKQALEKDIKAVAIEEEARLKEKVVPYIVPQLQEMLKRGVSISYKGYFLDKVFEKALNQAIVEYAKEQQAKKPN